MALDPFGALATLADSKAVQQLVSGEAPTIEDWALVAGGVVAALLTPMRGQSKTLGSIDKALASIEQQLSALPNTEYQQHIMAGERFLRDLPVSWRKEDDRADIIRDARGEFVRASAVAQQIGNAYLRALAEVAIASCWLWVPSLPDVQGTLGGARKILEEGVLNRADLKMVRAYIDVLRLCQAYGETGPVLRRGSPSLRAEQALPVDPAAVPAVPAVLAVNAETGQWVYCLGVWVRVGNVTLGKPGGWTSVEVDVMNERWPMVHVHLTAVPTALVPLVSTTEQLPVLPQRLSRMLRESDLFMKLRGKLGRLLDKESKALGDSNIPREDKDQALSQGDNLATTLWTEPVAGASQLAVMVRLPPCQVGALRGPSIAFLPGFLRSHD